jgi:hypothetical protein
MDARSLIALIEELRAEAEAHEERSVEAEQRYDFQVLAGERLEMAIKIRCADRIESMLVESDDPEIGDLFWIDGQSTSHTTIDELIENQLPMGVDEGDIVDIRQARILRNVSVEVTKEDDEYGYALIGYSDELPEHIDIGDSPAAEVER